MKHSNRAYVSNGFAAVESHIHYILNNFFEFYLND